MIKRHAKVNAQKHAKVNARKNMLRYMLKNMLTNVYGQKSLRGRILKNMLK
jgi:hypothetical protein